MNTCKCHILLSILCCEFSLLFTVPASGNPESSGESSSDEEDTVDASQLEGEQVT